MINHKAQTILNQERYKFALANFTTHDILDENNNKQDYLLTLLFDSETKMQVILNYFFKMQKAEKKVYRSLITSLEKFFYHRLNSEAIMDAWEFTNTSGFRDLVAKNEAKLLENIPFPDVNISWQDLIERLVQGYDGYINIRDLLNLICQIINEVEKTNFRLVVSNSNVVNYKLDLEEQKKYGILKYEKTLSYQLVDDESLAGGYYLLNNQDIVYFEDKPYISMRNLEYIISKIISDRPYLICLKEDLCHILDFHFKRQDLSGQTLNTVTLLLSNKHKNRL